MKQWIVLILLSLYLSACSILAPIHECQYTQRDLTVNWEERLYWCER